VTAAGGGSAALAAEALRVNARYVEEVVIGWNLCPWAARAWNDGQVVRRVFDAPVPAAVTGDVVAFAGELAANQDAAIGLAMFPRAGVTVGAWESFAERVRRGVRGFLIAAFSPRLRRRPRVAPPSIPRGWVAFIRRTPDPTLQLVRASLIDDLARDGRDLSDRHRARQPPHGHHARAGGRWPRCSPTSAAIARRRVRAAGAGLIQPTEMRAIGRICASGASSWNDSTGNPGCSPSIRRRT
jgi:hypothetical protein